ncbi:ABC transporter ATP-binding protein [Aliiglaciecola litoralis]|uniref:ABC transporter ATP-binding protein n=1 Tax=Aliiglaciecola litoralis TaxID=582857 RepID=UPI0031DB00AC
MSLELHHIDLTVNNQRYLDNINLTLESGAFNVLLGRTLAGKTSLLRVIAGLDKPTHGKIVLNGEDITTLAVQKRQVSMVYQQFINYPHMTVWENIASPLKLAKVSPSEITRRVSEIAELLHIEDFLQRLPVALSGGQQQRCAMARALVKDAQIILFDEPLVNLDYKLRESLRFELKALFKQRNSIAIYATTEAHEALALGGTTILLHQGKVLQSGGALAQYYQPANLNAADLYHEPPMNRVTLQVENGKWVVPFHHKNLVNVIANGLADGPYQCAIRPDQIALTNKDAEEIALAAKVDLAEISASETYLHVSLITPGYADIKWVVHLQGIHNFHYDADITLFLNLNSIYVFDQDGSSVCWPESIHLSNTQQAS